MHLSVLLSILAALVASACGASIAALNPREPANRLGALLMASVALWASCEVLWKVADDARSALAWHRVGALGIVFLGVHGAWFLCHLHERGLPRVRRWVPLLYAVNALFLGLVWTTPLMLAGMQRGPWGWSLVPGPLLPAWFALAAATIGFALVEWVRASRASGDALDGVYATRVGVGVAIAVAAAGTSDIALAWLGTSVPRVGSLAISSLGLAVVSALGRLDFSRLNASGVARRMLRILPDAVALLRPNGRIRVANPRMGEILQCADDEIEGRLLSEHLMLPLDPTVEQRALECELVQASGRRIPVSVSTAPLPTGSGQHSGLVVILRDLEEVVALRARLATTERLAAVGQLASGIAHEINNPLAFVRANLHHLGKQCAALAASSGPDGSAVADGALLDDFGEVIEESMQGVERALRIVRDLNAFSHGGGDTRQPVSLDELVDQVLDVAALGLAPGVRVERVSGAASEVHASPQRLKQLFLNLFWNAGRAVGEAGVIRVETRSEGDRVVATVSDDGCGIDSADLARVFDPFFTTGSAGDGAGLGLAICHEIVRSHGGTIELESARARGTRVRVTLPARPSEPAAATGRRRP
jgi:PAS domain S-box-containing protein